ncbi:MAG: hypothetical protein EOO38_01665 [Cytophagaceae bacterium]|nr:MAG: hypothetical protein EOO38_01665 [Cytophagaceae bacterium]
MAKNGYWGDSVMMLVQLEDKKEKMQRLENIADVMGLVVEGLGDSNQKRALKFLVSELDAIARYMDMEIEMDEEDAANAKERAALR